MSWPLAEGVLQRVDPGHVGGKAQLDLAVIGGEQQMARLGDEGAADLAALLGADRNVLDVGLARREPPGRGDGELEAGVDAAGLRLDLVDERVGIGRFQLLELAPVEDAARQIVGEGELLQHRGVGRIGAGLALLAAGQAELAEQHVAQLLRRADVELVAGEDIGLALVLGHALREIRGEGVQRLAVDLDALPLHLGDDRRERPLDRLVERGHALADEAPPEQRMQAQHHVGKLGGVVPGLVERGLGEADQRLAAAADVAVLRHLVAEMEARQLVEPVAVLHAVERRTTSASCSRSAPSVMP